MEFDTGESHKSLLHSELGALSTSAARLVSGNAGDHKLIHALLRTANQAPSYEEFLAWLDEPTYEPTDRLLVKHGGQIIAHVQVLDRHAWFHGVKLPVGGVAQLATLPEYRGAPYDRLLVSAAERALSDRRAVVGFTRTDRHEVFRDSGWSEVGSPRYTEANVNEVLGMLSSSSDDEPQARRRPLRIRRWRQVEIEALLEVYRQSSAATWGALDRSEAYWRWLVGRKSHDELIVAIYGRDDWDTLDALPHIVGYAMTAGSQVHELATLPEFPRAPEQLLARACQDAIERDYRTISLHVPVTDGLHELLLSAGGSWSAGGRIGGGTWLIKLFDPARWIESMYEVLLERAKVAGLPRSLTIAFDTGRRKCRLELTRRSGHLVREDAAAADVRCSPELFGALLVGNVDVAAARQAGLLEVRDDEVAERLAVLFPMTAFWQSQLDSPHC